MDNTELNRMDKVSGGLGKWGSRKSDVSTTIYANKVQESLKTCLYLLGKAFDDVTINPDPPSYGTTAKLGTARLGSMKLGQE